MKLSLPETLLSQLSEFISVKTALHFPREQWEDLERKAISAAKEFNFADPESFIRWVVGSTLTAGQLDILASHLTIHETYFWREPLVFEALCGQVLPELVRARAGGEKRLRLWSAGCATGEEPYSLAIALRRVLPDPENWHITILATDINPRVLRRAAEGVYGEWSFRNAPPWLKEKYLQSKGKGNYELIPEIRKMVTFAYLNLAEDIYPSPMNNTNAMDIIFCRNVTMYFAQERTRQVGLNLSRSLVDGGWLMVGASELSQQSFDSFTPVLFPGAIVYRKEGRETEPFAVLPAAGLFPGADFFSPLPESSALAEQAAPQPWPGESEIKQPAEVPAAQPAAQKDAPAVSAARPDMELAVRSLANQGKLAEALALCETAIASDKMNPGLHFLCAVILRELDRLEEEAASLKHTLYLDPDFVPAHYSMGNLLLRQGNARAARKAFNNALTLLNAFGHDDILPESEGLTAGRFREIIQATIQTGAGV
ncbi:MAG: CheR family methyltransferase [Elusimicrobiota bacterium]|nr:CheR family methyltransferase [Elusimicrobiota bacterium]